jgi:DNA-dependent protein kinase catalytic subunit
LVPLLHWVSGDHIIITTFLLLFLSLGVPELIPFRLTPHFVGVLEPIKTNGMIKENMIHTLKCFRNHKETILICLEVFIKEPTLDWLKQSRMRKSAGIVSDRESNASSVWDPEVRVNIVKKKLEGGNPMKLLVEELASGESKSKVDVLRARTNLIFGEVGGTRNKLRHEDMLRAEDQIECLIEMATDKAILATTYVGWDSWF